MEGNVELLKDACGRLPVTVRKMFGGYGFFAPNGGMFAGVLSADEIMLKLSVGETRDELIAIGGKPWVYPGKGKPVTMQEWIVVPSDFYDDQELFATWVKRAHAAVPAKKVSARKKAAKKKATPAAKKKARAKSARR